MSRPACLIFNPVAGQGDPDRDLETIKTVLSPEFDLDIQFTSAEIDAGELARQAIENGVEMLLAAGGDGTLSAVAEATVGTNIPVGAIPRGTANAFAAALGLPNNIEAACRMINNGITRRVDAGKCEGLSPSSNGGACLPRQGKSMVLLAEIGFGAEAIDNASRESKNRWGMLAYILSGIQQLRDLKSFAVEIEIEDKIVHLPEVNSVTVANVAPPTSILAQGPAGIIGDDGLLDVTIIAVEKWTEAIAASYHLLQSGLSGNAADREGIGYVRTKRVQITAEPPQKVVLDGEIIGTTPIEVECIPGGLTIFVPETEAEEPVEKLEGLPGVEIESKLE
jgi:YegS/Rv2252/BmrU family lipid kinase